MEETEKALEAEHDELQFPSFGFEDALAIGMDLVDAGRRKGLPIAIDVTVNRQQLFHAALPGSTPDNDRWIRRKRSVVEHFNRSSLSVAGKMRRQNRTLQEFGLTEADYALSGGSFPVIVQGSGVIGAITISGLPDPEDHPMVVESIRKHLTRRKNDA
jgi:uncharacterized protein (UPF0303 family)